MIESGHLTIGTGVMVDYDYNGDSINNPWYHTNSETLTITIDDGIINIGKFAFACIEGLAEISIPDSVISIGVGSFHSCTGLTSIAISDSVASIERMAFLGCAALTDVYYAGTMAQRAEIEIGNENYYLLNATWHFAKGPSEASGIYTLVTDIGQLAAGDEIILVSDNGANFFTMGSDFGGIQATTVYNSSLEAPSETEAFTLVEVEGDWLLSSGSVYLSVSNNSLTSVSEAESASVWSVSISNDIASITSNGAAICFDGTAFYYGSGGNQVAIYRSPRNDTYTITWLNYDGTILGTSDTRGGKVPVYTGETPTKPNDSDYSYQFVGWSPTLAVATADASYTAQYQANEKCGDDLYWFFDYETGVLTITGSGAMYNYPIYGSYGLLVKKQPWKSLQTLITSVVLQEGVTSISGEAFSNCTNLTSVAIPDSVTSIEGQAFYGCTGLTSITIPDSVIHIGNNAFDNTGWWNQQDEGLVYFSNILLGHKGAIDQPIVSIKEGTRLITGYALSVCSSIVRLSIPNSVTIIDEGAFSDCTGLTSVTIPKSVTIIGDSAFSYCTGLTSINLENNSIGNSMFSGCTGLTSITIPESITNIGSCAFFGCTGLTSITIPDSVTSLGGGGTFSGCTGLTELTMPCNLFYGDILNSTNVSRLRLTKGTGIMNSFNSWSNYDEHPMLTVSIDEGVTNIGQAVFAGMSFLSSISIPNSVKTIEDQAFYNCTGLTSITIPEDVTSLGNSAFSGCTGLTSLVVPDSVTSISYGSFSVCTGLTSVIIGNGVTSIGEYAFSGCSELYEGRLHLHCEEGRNDLRSRGEQLWFRVDLSEDAERCREGSGYSV